MNPILRMNPIQDESHFQDIQYILLQYILSWYGLKYFSEHTKFHSPIRELQTGGWTQQLEKMVSEHLTMGKTVVFLIVEKYYHVWITMELYPKIHCTTYIVIFIFAIMKIW